MGTTDEDYLAAAQTLLATCRMAAIQSLPVEAQARAHELLRPSARDRNRGPVGQQLLMDRGAALAAHLLHARLYTVGGTEDDEGGVAALVKQALPSLDAQDLAERLQGARLVAEAAPHGGRCELALRDLVTLLSRPDSETVAPAGHLCRRMMVDFGELYRPFADLAWWSWRGDRVLVPDAITRAAAASLVALGDQKTRVAERAGISRTTLDSWLRSHAGQR